MWASIPNIIYETAKVFRVNRADIQGKGRRKQPGLARHVVMYLARKLSRTTYEDIGSRFGLDHSTVIHGVKRIEALIQTDPELAAQVKAVEDALAGETAPPKAHTPLPCGPEWLLAVLMMIEALKPQAVHKPVDKPLVSIGTMRAVVVAPPPKVYTPSRRALA